jgi:hypothetical protein
MGWQVAHYTSFANEESKKATLHLPWGETHELAIRNMDNGKRCISKWELYDDALLIGSASHPTKGAAKLLAPYLKMQADLAVQLDALTMP